MQLPPYKGLFLLPIVLLAIGCGSDEHCAGEPRDESAEAPRITELSVQQDATAADPWEVVFVADFEDSDGDLAAGSADFFIGDSPDAVQVVLFDVFRQSGVSLDAKSGKLGMALRFSESIQDGISAWVSMQLIDGDERRSNCYSLDMTFHVSPRAATAQ